MGGKLVRVSSDPQYLAYTSRGGEWGEGNILGQPLASLLVTNSSRQSSLGSEMYKHAHTTHSRQMALSQDQGVGSLFRGSSSVSRNDWTHKLVVHEGEVPGKCTGPEQCFTQWSRDRPYSP